MSPLHAARRRLQLDFSLLRSAGLASNTHGSRKATRQDTARGGERAESVSRANWPSRVRNPPNIQHSIVTEIDAVVNLCLQSHAIARSLFYVKETILIHIWGLKSMWEWRNEDGGAKCSWCFTGSLRFLSPTKRIAYPTPPQLIPFIIIPFSLRNYYFFFLSPAHD